MELIEFSTWLKNTCNFDSNENEFLKTALVQTFNQLNDSTVDGVRFFEYHQRPKLNYKILEQYLGQLSLLLQLMPQSLDTHLTIDGLNLHEFSRLKGELQLKIFQLKCLYEGL